MRFIALLLAVFTAGLFLNSPARADQAGAQAFIDDLAHKVIDVLKENTSADQKNAQLRQVFEGHVAINWVGQFVLGRHWREANDGQKQAYLANYKAFVLNSYSQRLQDYTGETYRILGTKPSGPGRWLVAMQIDRPNAQAPVMVNYRLREDNGGYQVYDLEVEGVSLIQTQRSEFDSVVSNKGLDYLISQLQAKAGSTAKPPV